MKMKKSGGHKILGIANLSGFRAASPGRGVQGVHGKTPCEKDENNNQIK
jgi:hypothetical protein